MADERRAGTSDCIMTRSRKKKMKPEIVEISDSSSESDVEGTATASKKSVMLKSTPVSNAAVTPNPASSELSMECPVCLQNCIHPARLPCGHIFCFLCLKGIAQQSRRCAMCRKEISPDYLDKPDLLQELSTNAEKETFEDGYQWFYEGRNGWWQYDGRTSRELEASYKAGLKTCELLIAGFLYIADFEGMIQARQNEPHRRRKIKRDLANIPKKGIAGIRQNVNVDSISEQLSALTINDATTDQE